MLRNMTDNGNFLNDHLQSSFGGMPRECIKAFYGLPKLSAFLKGQTAISFTFSRQQILRGFSNVKSSGI